MARRSLSMKGRVLAAGASIAVGGALMGFMAAGDHTADASGSGSSATRSVGSSDGGGVAATPDDGRSSDDGFGGFPTDDSGFQPQPQTRTGGS